MQLPLLYIIQCLLSFVFTWHNITVRWKLLIFQPAWKRGPEKIAKWQSADLRFLCVSVYSVFFFLWACWCCLSIGTCNTQQNWSEPHLLGTRNTFYRVECQLDLEIQNPEWDSTIYKHICTWFCIFGLLCEINEKHHHEQKCSRHIHGPSCRT